MSFASSQSEFSPDPLVSDFNNFVTTDKSFAIADKVTSHSPGSPRHIAFVDAGLFDVEGLIAGIDSAQVVLIESGSDGGAQITSALNQHNNLESVQIYAHGSDGLLQLGDTLLSVATLKAHTENLSQWSSALSTEADLMIYGCNLVSGESGLSQVERHGEHTSADVADTTDVTSARGDRD